MKNTLWDYALRSCCFFQFEIINRITMMHCSVVIFILYLLIVTQGQILPNNVQRKRQRLTNLPNFPWNNWSPYLSAKKVLGSALLSSKAIGNVINKSMGTTASSEVVSGVDVASINETPPLLSPEVRRQAQAALAAGMDIADIQVLRNYPRHLLEKLEESLTESQAPVNLVNNKTNPLILSQLISNSVRNGQFGNNIYQQPFGKNFMSNSASNGGLQTNLQNSLPKMDGQLPSAAVQMNLNTKRSSKTVKDVKPNTVDTRVISLLMKLSRLWNEKQNLASSGSFETRTVLDKINNIVKVLSPQSRQIVMPLISQFRQSQTGFQESNGGSKSVTVNKSPKATNRIRLNPANNAAKFLTINNRLNAGLQKSGFMSPSMNRAKTNGNILIPTSAFYQTTQLAKPSQMSIIPVNRIGFQSSNGLLPVIRSNRHTGFNKQTVTEGKSSVIYPQSVSIPFDGKVDRSDIVSKNNNKQVLSGPSLSTVTPAVTSTGRSSVSTTAVKNHPPRMENKSELRNMLANAPVPIITNAESSSRARRISVPGNKENPLPQSLSETENTTKAPSVHVNSQSQIATTKSETLNLMDNRHPVSKVDQKQIFNTMKPKVPSVPAAVLTNTEQPLPFYSSSIVTRTTTTAPSDIIHRKTNASISATGFLRNGKADRSEITVSQRRNTLTEEKNNRNLSRKEVARHLRDRKMLIVTWNAFSKSLHNMATYGSKLLGLIEKMINPRVFTQV